jgi:hypothetical protein
MRRIWLAALVVLAGCTPGTYNVNVGLAPLAATPTPAASSTPAPTASAPAAASTSKPTPGAPSQDNVTTYQQIGNGTRLAQTFEVPKDGQLAAIAVRVKGGAADRQPTATIVPLKDDKPDAGTALASATVEATSDANAWAPASFSPPLAVKAGDKYALVLALDSKFEVYLGATLDTEYGAGTAFTGLSSFWNKLGQDLAFRTTIQ